MTAKYQQPTRYATAQTTYKQLWCFAHTRPSGGYIGATEASLLLLLFVALCRNQNNYKAQV